MTSSSEPTNVIHALAKVAEQLVAHAPEPYRSELQQIVDQAEAVNADDAARDRSVA